MLLLSILIPTIRKHKEKFRRLANCLSKQMGEDYRIEVIYDDDEKLTTGAKRNRLLQQAKGKYVVFIDSDDEIPDYYLQELIEAIKSDADVIAINGIITTNGKAERKWFISKDLPYKDSSDQNGRRIYLRYPNHITPMKREIAIQVPFPDKTIGEDYEWATKLHNLGLIKTEHRIEKPMYHYQYVR